MTISATETAANTAGPQPAPGPRMSWIPGGTFLMGSDHHYPEEAPAHRVSVDGFWMDSAPVTNAQFRTFVAETGHVTFAEIAAGPGPVSGREARAPVSGFARFRQTNGTGGHAGLPQLVEIHARRRLASSARSQFERFTDRDDHPVVHVAYADAEAYARWAGKAAADRGRVGDGRARRARGRRVRLGRRTPAGRPADGELLAGRVSLAEPEDGRLRRHLAGWSVPAERVRPVWT